MLVSRRSLLAALPLVMVATRLRAGDEWHDPIVEALSTVEASGMRFGLALHDTGSGRRFSHRGNDRVALASTFKFVLAAAILARVDAGGLALAQTVIVKRSDLLQHSPFTETRVTGPPPTIADLCSATMTLSDNAAANLLLPLIGGPAGLTDFLRHIGDPVTRLDRTEPALNIVPPGALRDTTSPLAMLTTLRRIVTGPVLSPRSRQHMIDWLCANTTGDKRLRAGLPRDWRVGDKTGSWNGEVANDIAVVWPAPQQSPIFITAYVRRLSDVAMPFDAAFADVARAVATALHC